MTNNYLPKIIMMQMIAPFPTHVYAIIGLYTPLLVIILVLYNEMGHYSIKNNGRIMPYNSDAKRPHVTRFVYIMTILWSNNGQIMTSNDHIKKYWPNKDQ